MDDSAVGAVGVRTRSDDQKKKKSEVDVYVQHVQNRNLVKTFQVELSVLHLLRKHLTDPSQNGQGPR